MLIKSFRNRSTFAAPVTAALFVLPALANAQVVPAKVHVVVDGKTSLSVCGLSRESLDGAAKASLRYSRIEVIEPENGYLVFPVMAVIADTKETANGCQTVLRISLVQRDAYPDGSGGFYNGHFVFCEAASTLSGSNHANLVLEAVRDNVNTCLGGVSKTDSADLLRRLLEGTEK